MATLYKANSIVCGGTYLNLKEGEFVNVPQEGGILPGKAEASYFKVPAAAVLVLGPILGLLFIIFLPMAVPLVLLSIGARNLGIKLGLKLEGAREAAMQMTLPSQVRVAATNRGAGQGRERENVDEMSETELDDLISELEHEIAQRKKQGE